jgi:hypothetical protein
MIRGLRFSYDEKYYYKDVFNHETGCIDQEIVTNAYGWYYPEEPGIGEHRPPQSWQH